jgi:hypothetical protein
MRVQILVSAVACLASTTLGAQAPRAPRVQASIVQVKESTPLRIVLLVRVEGKGVMLGSYEGRLRFDPTVFAVDSASVSRDGSRFVNAADAARGEVRFAGFTTSRFNTTDAVRIVGHASKPLDAAKLTAILVVAGDIDGNKIPVVNSTRVDTEK